MRPKPYAVLELFVVFRYEREYVDRRDTNKITKVIRRWTTTGKHTRYTVSYVIVTDETPEDLVERIRPALDILNVVEDYECQTVKLDVIGKNGIASPFRSRVIEAYAEIEKRNKTEYMRKRRPRNARVTDGIEKLYGEAEVKVIASRPRERKILRYPDSPNR